MTQRRDRLSIGGREVYGESVGGADESASPKPGETRPFLSVWYRCCHVYGRMTRNRAQTKYIGRCPKCGARVTARIGPDGTSQRVFQAR